MKTEFKPFVSLRATRAAPACAAEANVAIGRDVSGGRPLDTDGLLVEYGNGHKSWAPLDYADDSYVEVPLDRRLSPVEAVAFLSSGIVLEDADEEYQLVREVAPPGATRDVGKFYFVVRLPSGATVRPEPIVLMKLLTEPGRWRVMCRNLVWPLVVIGRRGGGLEAWPTTVLTSEDEIESGAHLERAKRNAMAAGFVEKDLIVVRDDDPLAGMLSGELWGRPPSEA